MFETYMMVMASIAITAAALTGLAIVVCVMLGVIADYRNFRL